MPASLTGSPAARALRLECAALPRLPGGDAALVPVSLSGVEAVLMNQNGWIG